MKYTLSILFPRLTLTEKLQVPPGQLQIRNLIIRLFCQTVSDYFPWVLLSNKKLDRYDEIIREQEYEKCDNPVFFCRNCDWSGKGPIHKNIYNKRNKEHTNHNDSWQNDSILICCTGIPVVYDFIIRKAEIKNSRKL